MTEDANSAFLKRCVTDQIKAVNEINNIDGNIYTQKIHNIVILWKNIYIVIYVFLLFKIK